MAALKPTKQMLDLCGRAAVSARNAMNLVAELKALLDFVAASPSAAGIPLADFTDQGTAGALWGFEPAAFASFVAAANVVVAAVAANGNAAAKGFAALAERS